MYSVVYIISDKRNLWQDSFRVRAQSEYEAKHILKSLMKIPIKHQKVLFCYMSTRKCINDLEVD